MYCLNINASWLVILKECAAKLNLSSLTIGLFCATYFKTHHTFMAEAVSYENLCIINNCMIANVQVGLLPQRIKTKSCVYHVQFTTSRGRCCLRWEWHIRHSVLCEGKVLNCEITEGSKEQYIISVNYTGVLYLQLQIAQWERVDMCACSEK